MTNQEAILTRLANADNAWRDAKKMALAKYRRLANEEIHDLRVARDIIAAEAFHAGLKKARIAREGLHTSNAKTADEAIAAGSVLFVPDQFEDDEEIPTAQQLEFTLENGRVTLDESVFLKFGLESQGGSYGFHLNESGAVAPDDGDEDATWQHPVVKIVMSPGGESIRRQIAEALGA